MRTEEQLIEEIKTANTALYKIRDAERRKRNAPLVGKTFRYRNSSSGDKRWWLYARVEKVDSGGHLRVFQFQTDCFDRIEVKFNDYAYDHLIDGFTPIPASKFNSEWKRVQKRIAAHR